MVVPLPLALIISLPPLLQDSLENLMNILHLGLDALSSHTLCIISGYGSLYLFPSSARERFFDDGRALNILLLILKIEDYANFLDIWMDMQLSCLFQL